MKENFVHGMQFPKTNFDENQLIKIAQKYRIKELALFGSALREDFTNNSDIDLLVVFQEDVDYSYFDILEIKKEFEKIFQRPVDLIEKDALKNPFRRKAILDSARTIYAA